MHEDSAPDYGVVLVTAPSQEEAEAIAQSLVEAGIAACVSLMPGRSIYRWQGQLHSEQQWQMIIKTELSQYEQLEAKIRELHSDEVPEIIALPIVAGYQPYLDWMSNRGQ